MRGSVLRARGRCWLVVGSAESEGVEAELEWDGEDAVLGGQKEDGGSERVAKVLASEDAEEARDALEKAMGYFERARAVDDVHMAESEGDVEDVGPLVRI